jgi:hypothetical protein
VSTHLLDVNLLIALAWPQHVHHAQAHDWFGTVGHTSWATCPLTQLAFVRLSSNPRIIAEAVSPREALETLKRIVAVSGHRFWHDEISPMDAAVFSSLALVGHRQITDAYLLALSQHHDGKLATFDAGIAELIPVHKDRARHVTLIR